MIRYFSSMFFLVLLSAPVVAHDGRRFEVKVIDGQLFAHGYISDGVTDGGSNLDVANPGDPLYRTYYNAIHGHFKNGGAGFAFATLPGYDILGNADELIGYSLNWEAVAFGVWSTPSMTGPVTSLNALATGERIEVLLGGQEVDSSVGLGSIELVSSSASTVLDIDLSYDLYGDHPSGEIHIIQSRLTTDAPGVADSDVIYTILSPDGSGPVERLHHHSLNAESFLGTAVPEPASLGLLGIGGFVLMRRKRT